MTTYTSTYTGEEIDSNIKKFFNSLSTVTVVTEYGATVTMSKGSTVLYSKGDNGRYVFHPLEFGTWTISVSKNQSSAQQTIDIKSIKLNTVIINLS